MQPIISIENLSKSYMVSHKARPREAYETFRDVLGRSCGNFIRSCGDILAGRQVVQGDSVELFWALQNISFEINRGDVVGIIGRNGAGKSTMLKILSRITEPTLGRVTLRGRVASLLEVGTGFHPELTGRENIFLNGAILGMSRTEIKRKFDDIVGFAEVERFLDTPVKRYSSGMYVRLAFAVAAHLEPEILVVDEVLAVGDAEFQRKCLGKMGELAHGGRTVFFVSHNMDAVKSLCTRCVWLESGKVAKLGDVVSLVDDYVSSGSQNYSESILENIKLGEDLELEKLEWHPVAPQSGSTVSFRLQLRSDRLVNISHLCLIITSLHQTRVAILDMRSKDDSGPLKCERELTLGVDVECMPLVEGQYRVGLYAVFGDTTFTDLELGSLDITDCASSSNFIRYPSEHRGIVELRYATCRLP